MLRVLTLLRRCVGLEELMRGRPLRPLGEAKKPIEWGRRDWQLHRAHWFRIHVGSAFTLAIHGGPRDKAGAPPAPVIPNPQPNLRAAIMGDRESRRAALHGLPLLRQSWYPDDTRVCFILRELPLQDQRAALLAMGERPPDAPLLAGYCDIGQRRYLERFNKPGQLQ